MPERNNTKSDKAPEKQKKHESMEQFATRRERETKKR